MEKQNTQAPVGWLGSYEEMGLYCGRSKRTIAGWVSSGRLRVKRLSSRCVMCRPADLDRCIQDLADEFEMREGQI